MKRELEPLQLTGHCYVLLRGNWYHPIAERRFDLVWYPETAMSLFDQHQYRPYVKSVVTECPWIIGLYDHSFVRCVGDDGIWRMPRMQTYGGDVSYITRELLHIRPSIPAMTLDGGRSFKKVIRDYAKYIAKAHKIYKETI